MAIYGMAFFMCNKIPYTTWSRHYVVTVLSQPCHVPELISVHVRI